MIVQGVAGSQKWVRLALQGADFSQITPRNEKILYLHSSEVTGFVSKVLFSRDFGVVELKEQLEAKSSIFGGHRSSRQLGLGSVHGVGSQF